MRFRCHKCSTEFNQEYAVYFETPGNPNCPLCHSNVAGVQEFAQLTYSAASSKEITRLLSINHKIILEIDIDDLNKHEITAELRLGLCIKKLKEYESIILGLRKIIFLEE